MKSVSLIIVILAIGFYIYMQHTKNLLISQNERLTSKLNFYEYYFNLHKELEGKFIYKIFDIDKEVFEGFINQKGINEDFIYLQVDSLDCMSCLDFNLQNIRLLNKKKSFVVVANSELYQHIIKSELKEAIIFNNRMNPNQYLPSKKVAVFHLNPQGRIINFDVSDSYGFDLTKYFYHILGN